ncbi:MAG: TIGR01777 family oxidoreductase [Actinomycetota bacterium]|nr:TIGR01777 family oxidoreductase [Actinomycetota bacterium]
MQIAVTGTHGLIARHLIPRLEAAGHRVTALVRSQPEPGQVHWDPDASELDATELEGIDAVIHLAGVGLFRRWSSDHKRRIFDSRVKGTTLLADRLAGLDHKPAVLLSGSAVGYYGDRGDEILTEDSEGGAGFLADLCARWEGAAEAATAAGIRTVLLRTGIVQAPDGGALGTQLPIFKLGAGGRLGNGRQWTSWISVDDEVGAIVHALGAENLSGPINLTTPEPVTNRTYTKVLGQVLHRPAVLAVPALAIRTVLGAEMANEMLLGGQRALPVALERSGYRFAHRSLAGALTAALER